jgi:hypothetical protein
MLWLIGRHCTGGGKLYE